MFTNACLIKAYELGSNRAHNPEAAGSGFRKKGRLAILCLRGLLRWVILCLVEALCKHLEEWLSTPFVTLVLCVHWTQKSQMCSSGE